MDLIAFEYSNSPYGIHEEFKWISYGSVCFGFKLSFKIEIYWWWFSWFASFWLEKFDTNKQVFFHSAFLVRMIHELIHFSRGVFLPGMSHEYVSIITDPILILKNDFSRYSAILLYCGQNVFWKCGYTHTDISIYPCTHTHASYLYVLFVIIY